MRRKLLSILSFAAIAFMMSCTDQKDYYIPTSEDELINFDWKTTSDVNLEVTVEELSGSLNEFYRTVSVYTDKTMEPGSLVATGGALPSKPFKTAFTIPTYVQTLYLSVKDGANREKQYECTVSNSMSINTATTAEISTRTRSEAPTAPEFAIPSASELAAMPALTSNADKLNPGTYVVPAGSHVRIDNPNVFGPAPYGKTPLTKIYVAGTLEIKETSGANIRDRIIIVLDGGEVIGERIFVRPTSQEGGSPELYVAKGGKLRTTLLGISEDATLANHGEIDCERLHLYKGTVVHNAGRLTISVRGGFSHNATIHCYPGSLTEATAQIHTSSVADQGLMVMHPNSIMYLGGFDIENGNSEDYAGSSSGSGWGSYNTRFTAPYGEGKNKALLIISAKYYEPSASKKYEIDGDIDVHIPNLTDKGLQSMKNANCIDETILVTRGTLDSRGTQGGVYIDNNGLNRGYGVFHIPDHDGDKVSTPHDVDDNDPEVAYHSFFPSPIRFATVMFEDRWPETGDYDMNDLVTCFRVEYVTNTNNDVVRMNIKWRARAAGATNRIGFAMQLDDIAPSEIKSTTTTYNLEGDSPFKLVNDGRLLEEGQSKAVIPFFNDFSDIFGVNTYANTRGNYKKADIETFSFYFGSRGNGAISKSRLTSDKMNPFIVVNERECEIHLPDFKRTDKGTKIADNEQLDRFKTEEGMMWGIMVPKAIKYANEEVNIENGYTLFKEWYMSGGTKAADWYENSSATNSGSLYSGEGYIEFH